MPHKPAASVFEPDELLQRLARSRVRHIVVGGVAVGSHGVIRATKDLDICPAPDHANLERLARLLVELNAVQADSADFLPAELPYDPTRPADLAQGGNFRLVTDLGRLDIMQWLAGIEDELAYATLDSEAVDFPWRGVSIRVCSLAHLKAMKRAAGRPQDLLDLENLEIANQP